MWNFDLGKAFGVLIQTWPFILFRMAVYFGIALAYILATGTGAGTGWVLSNFWSDPGAEVNGTLWGGLAGFGMVSALLYWFREYVLYLVKAGHIAVMVELLEGKPIPGGRSQIDYAQTVVRERFVESSVLFGVDQLIKGVLAVITGTIHTMASIIPIPGLDTVVRFVNAVLRVSLTYVDELVLAYMIRTRTTNPFETAKDGVILFAQNYWAFAKNAIVLTVLMYLLTILIFIAVIAPAAALAAWLPGSWTVWGFVIAILVAWSFKAALLEPLAIACLMQVYFKVIEGQTPDPAWDARLTQLSGKFSTLKQKAVAYLPQARRA